MNCRRSSEMEIRGEEIAAAEKSWKYEWGGKKYSLLAAARAASAANSTRRRASRQQVDGAIGRRVRVASERRRLKSTCQRMSCPSARKNHRKPTHSLTAGVRPATTAAALSRLPQKSVGGIRPAFYSDCFLRPQKSPSIQCGYFASDRQQKFNFAQMCARVKSV